MDHVLTDADLGTDKRYRRRLCARCTCGYLTPVVGDRQKNDDAKTDHLRQARRDRLGLGVQRPSLTTTLAHYETMAAHPATTIPERSQWNRLAEEIRERIVSTTRDDAIGQDSLFDQ